MKLTLETKQEREDLILLFESLIPEVQDALKNNNTIPNKIIVSGKLTYISITFRAYEIPDPYNQQLTGDTHEKPNQ